jgi:hypothetical protein
MRNCSCIICSDCLVFILFWADLDDEHVDFLYFSVALETFDGERDFSALDIIGYVLDEPLGAYTCLNSLKTLGGVP